MAEISLPGTRERRNRDLLAGPSAGELRRLFDLAVQMLCVAGTDGYFRCVNPAFETTLGYTREELLSRPYIELVHPDDREATLAEVRKLSEGIPTVHFENRYRCRDGSYRWLLWTSSPATESDLLFATATDVTDRKAAETEIETNLHIQRAVSSILRVCLESTSLEEQLHRSLEVLSATPWIARQSGGSIFLVEEDPRVLVRKADFGLPAESQAFCGEVPLGKCLCGRAGASRQIEFADGPDPRHEMRCEGVPAHGHYCVPIVSEEKLRGVLNLYIEAGHERKPREEQFLYSVADVLAGAIRRNRTETALERREAELVAAQKIQERLLPDAPPDLPGFDIAGASRPADFAAGDYFDYLTMPDESLGIAIADVSGHGIGTALLAASTRALLRSLANHHTDIDEILTVANSVLLDETDDDYFVTLLFGRLDPRRRRFAYASAGHETAYLLGRSGEVKARLASTSFPLAVLPGIGFPACDWMPLEAGDILVVPTDGILEARSREGTPFGAERMLEAVRANRHRAAGEIIECLYREVSGFIQPNKATDDLTAVLIKVEPDA
jgi:PAS domain S-box-containing protein